MMNDEAIRNGFFLLSICLIISRYAALAAFAMANHEVFRGVLGIEREND